VAITRIDGISMQLLQAATPRAGSADRIAAKVVPGVGFLGAGVIIRDGLKIRAVNTAATCGVRPPSAPSLVRASPSATIGAGAAVHANLLLRPLARAIDRQPIGAIEVPRCGQIPRAAR
jgi:putative Mg2+ transporter-C (MgtC) family protein